MSEKCVKVLQVLIGGDAFTGVASYLYQQYLHIDREKVRYDFLFTKKNSMKLVADQEIFAESRFIELSAVKGKRGSNDYWKIVSGLKKVLQNGEYDFVVVNTSVVEVIFACLMGASFGKKVPVIAHAHNTKIVLEKSSIRNKIVIFINILEGFLRTVIRKKAAWLFACSREAGAFTFGEKALESKKFRVIRNAIDLEAFRPDEIKRQEIRRAANAQEAHVYGNVGYFCKRKNQLFLLDVFAEILKKKTNSLLWIIGEGEYDEALHKKAKDLKVADKVTFWGQRSDVPEIMQGMDSFLFPSLSEGLGIVAIEAQASALPTFISDGVPEETMITDLCERIPLASDAETWAKEILSREEALGSAREAREQIIREAGYDILAETKKIEAFYTKS